MKPSKQNNFPTFPEGTNLTGPVKPTRGLQVGAYNPTIGGNAAAAIANTTQSPDMSSAIRQLYLTQLGREPDPGGYEYWSQQFGPSVSPEEVNTFRSVAQQTEPANLAPSAGLFSSNAYTPFYSFLNPFFGVTPEFGPTPLMSGGDLANWYNQPQQPMGMQQGVAPLKPPVQPQQAAPQVPWYRDTRPFPQQTIPGTDFQIPAPNSPAYDPVAAENTTALIEALQAEVAAGRGDQPFIIQGINDAQSKLNAAAQLGQALGMSLDQAVEHMYGTTVSDIIQTYAPQYNNAGAALENPSMFADVVLPTTTLPSVPGYTEAQISTAQRLVDAMGGNLEDRLRVAFGAPAV